MATDRGTPPSSPDTDAWLDGLAGRDGASDAARDGARLRAALKPASDETVKADAAKWQRIVQAAKTPGADDLVQMPTHMPTQGHVRATHDREAANQSQWRRLAGGALAVVAVVLGAGLWTMTGKDGDESTRLRGGGSANGAVWRTDNPSQAGQDLARRLLATGATVALAPSNDGVTLFVECLPVSCQAVNEQLAPLDTAVDSSGRLSLQVLPKR